MGQLILNPTKKKREEPIGGCMNTPAYEAGDSVGKVKYKNKKDNPIGGSMSNASI